jgi:hypothetical protein
MRTALLMSVLVACEFSTPVSQPGAIDAPPTIDARPDAKPLPACPAAPSGCTAAFDCPTHPASCFYYCATGDQSNDANTRCASIATGACLVTLNDAAESMCVLAAAGAGSLIYIGLRQPGGSSEPNGDWGWYCGTSTYGPTWSNGEPNNSGLGGEDCAASTPQGLWVDVGCGESFRFICEAPRPPAT